MQGVTFPFPDRLTLPVQTIIPLKTIATCYTCHRISYPAPAGNLSGRSLYTAPVIGGTENGKLTRLTNSDESDLNPRFSPDGSLIAYVSGPPGSSHLWVMNSDGSSIISLVETTNVLERPVWRPDGQHIAYAEERDGNWDIWVSASDASKSWRMTSSADMDTSPHWSPDSKKIVFESNRGGNLDIWVMPVE